MMVGKHYVGEATGLIENCSIPASVSTGDAPGALPRQRADSYVTSDAPFTVHCSVLLFSADCCRSLALLGSRVVRSCHHRRVRCRDQSMQILLVTTGHAAPQFLSTSLLVAQACRVSVPSGGVGACAVRSEGRVVWTLSVRWRPVSRSVPVRALVMGEARR